MPNNIKKQFMPIGALVNAITVILGALIGLLLRKQLNQAFQNHLFEAMGLGVLLMGIQMGVKLNTKLWVPAMLSLLVGTIIGTHLDLVSQFSHLADALKGLFCINDPNFSEGLITAFIIFCIGAMTILGSLEEGLSGDRSLILTKSILDGFTSIFLAGAFGIGVMFSVVPLFLLQSSITLGASKLKSLLHHEDLDLLSGVGGILIMGIGIEMIGLKDIRLENMFPALFFLPIVSRITRLATFTKQG